jgi:Flp pilus assembly protein TadD
MEDIMGIARTGLAVGLLALGSLALPALAETPEEIGYKQGSLGVSSILAGDYAAAAERLNSMDGVNATDPARLLNLGAAYAGLGRYADARAAYEKAFWAKPVDMMLANGSVRSSRALAREGMKRLDAGSKIASR